MQIPDKTPLTIFQGSDIDLPPLRVKGADGNYLDFTGFTARLQARFSPNDVGVGTLLLELTTENGGISINGPSITLRRTAAQTAVLNFGPTGQASYDMELVQPGTGYVFKYFYGPITLIPEVTR